MSLCLVRRAREFAIAAHGDQLYGKEPYSVHLQAVHDVLKEFGFNNSDLLAAAWLHDVLEDTDDGIADFPVEVIKIVVAVTDEPGYPDRAACKAATYLKIAAHGPFAIVLKLADRLANAQASIRGNAEKLKMYLAEHAAFRTALYRDDASAQTKALWSALDELLGAVAL